MMLRSQAERTRKTHWDTLAAFAGHQLLDETRWHDGARWLIGRPASSVYRVEIIASQRSLLVHGDIDTFRFSYGPRDPVQCLLWLSDRCPPDRYLIEKARIGTGSDPEMYDPDAAAEDLPEGFADAHVRWDGRDALIQALVDDGHDACDLGHVGMITCPQLICAVVAINKCAALLREAGCLTGG